MLISPFFLDLICEHLYWVTIKHAHNDIIKFDPNRAQNKQSFDTKVAYIK